MASAIRMPKLSDTMTEGNLVKWYKKVGEKVEKGDVLADVETDKATQEIESFSAGVLLHIGIESGPVPVNGLIAVIGKEGEDISSLLGGAAQPAAKPAPAAQPAAQPATAAATPVAMAAAQASAADGGRVKASPLAKSMAHETGVDISKIEGSGDNGRIVRRDVEAFLSAKPAEKPAPSTPAAAGGFEDVPVTQMRAVIARRLGESLFTAPHFYLTVEILMDKMMEARTRMNELSPVKISFNDIVVKAVAVALRQHPNVNSSWLGDRIRRYSYVNIGVAVAIEDGLLVPVVKAADQKSLSQINTEVKALAEKAKSRKLSPDEMTGNTFTISNLGMFGIEEFTAIINPPDSCILAVSGIHQKPVVRDGQIVVGNTMKVTLSCDHRVVDGATGAAFLNTLKGILEEPMRMLI